MTQWFKKVSAYALLGWQLCVHLIKRLLFKNHRQLSDLNAELAKESIMPMSVKQRQHMNTVLYCTACGVCDSIKNNSRYTTSQLVVRLGRELADKEEERALYNFIKPYVSEIERICPEQVKIWVDDV